MAFEYDPDKAKLNLAKHGIDFVDVEPVFFDPQAFTNRSDRLTVAGTLEERFVTTGRDSLDRIVTVAWTRRAKNIRLICARCARTTEKKAYEHR